MTEGLETYEPPATLTTTQVMRVLEDKVSASGSADKIFRAMDFNYNGKLDARELCEAIRPFEIALDERQAKEVLGEINRIAGAKPAAELEYHSFARAFNPLPSALGALPMGARAYEPPQPSVIVQRRQPAGVDRLLEASLGDVRTLEPNAIGANSRGSMRTSMIETVEHMRSLSTIIPPRSLASLHSAGSLLPGPEPVPDRHDMKAAWRGIAGLGYDDGQHGGSNAVTHVGTERDIDWNAFKHDEKTQTVFSRGKRTTTSPTLGAADPARFSVPTPGATPLEQGPKGRGPAWNASQLAFAASPANPNSATCLLRSSKSSPTLARTGSGTSLHQHTRSNLSLTLDNLGSRSVADALQPGTGSHFHLSERQRLAKTSSIASFSSYSSTYRRNPIQLEEVECRNETRRAHAQRQAERELRIERLVSDREAKVDALVEQRIRTKCAFEKRAASQQLCQISRGLENGKKPVLFEPGATAAWVQVPPQLSSHWGTISGQLQAMNDPTGRVGEVKPVGRRSFSEKAMAR